MPRALRLLVLGAMALSSFALTARAEETLPWQNSAAKAAAAAAEKAKAAATEKVEGSMTPTAASSAPSSDAVKPVLTQDSGAAKEKPSASADAKAQDGSSKNAEKTATLVPAKKLFGTAKAPSSLKSRAIGAYSRGCLAGATALPIDGPGWQAMRLSRNRNWGHPRLIALLERFAGEVKTKDGWPGLLVGDISQPRGGPMLTGHASHQLGLDADIWFTPMPARRLTKSEREKLSATSMLASDNLSVNPKVWGEGQVNIVRRVASYKEVERVLVHPAIKKALCEAPGKERAWLAKVRPYWGHFYHFHVRMGCPPDSPTCSKQAPIPGGEGCDKELDDWFKLLTAPPRPKPVKPAKPVKPKPPITLADLPAECTDVIESEPATVTATPDTSKPGTQKATQKSPAAKKKTATTE